MENDNLNGAIPKSSSKIPTIRDVAKEAGVSIATVSRVLNKAEHPVKESTRLKVLDVAREIGFRPNASAQELLKRQTKTLGVLIPDISNPYYASILQGAQEVSEKAGYYMLLGNTNRDEQRQSEHLAIFAAKRVAGVVVLGGSLRESDVHTLQSIGIPITVVNRHVGNLPSVQVDNVEIGKMATKHLLDSGCKSIAFLGGYSSSTTMQDRALGCREVMNKNIQVLWGDLSADWGADAVQDVEADGIVCGNDMVALGVLHGLFQKKCRVPQDVSVIGCDDVGIARNTLPSLTSISVPSNRLGKKVVNILLDIIQSKKIPEEPIILPSKLHIRDSS